MIKSWAIRTRASRGATTCRYAGRRACFTTLSLIPRIATKASAGRLLDATLDALRLGGARQIVLSTAERNDPAQHLFDRAGFRRTMIEMTRDLDADDR
jgi:RimJ/RimL family protein N-acetyltransferase